MGGLILTLLSLQAHQVDPMPSIWPVPSKVNPSILLNSIHLLMVRSLIFETGGATRFPKTCNHKET